MMCAHSTRFCAIRNKRWERMLRKMSNMRAAKARKRFENPPQEREPKMGRGIPLQLGVRDKTSGDTAWCDLKSVRDATRRLSAVLRYYQPGNHAPLAPLRGK